MSGIGLGSYHLHRVGKRIQNRKDEGNHFWKNRCCGGMEIHGTVSRLHPREQHFRVCAEADVRSKARQ